MEQFVQKSCSPSSLLKIELQQAVDEGKNIERFVKEVSHIASISDECQLEREQLATQLFESIKKESIRADYSYQEPEEWSQALSLHGDKKYSEGNNILSYEKIYGGVLGKCIGCLLGKPVEGWTKEKIHSLLVETDNIPLNKYIFDQLDSHILQQYSLSTEWLNLSKGMPEDDDVNYMLVNTKLLQEFGLHFTSRHVAETWTNVLPLQRLCTAERIAYRNFVNGIYPPLSASFCNPYREWIGAAIRADVFGFVSVGKPYQAANLAWKDAQISHTKNGIYGAVWVAVMISLEGSCQDFKRLICDALNFIPQQSRLYQSIMMVIQWYDSGMCVDDAISSIHQLYTESNIHHWCHVIPNLMIVSAALLYGQRDFTRSLQISLTAGFDTDSHGALVGSIIGYNVGADNIPGCWGDQLDDCIHSPVANMEKIKISALVKNIVDMAKNFR